MRDARARTARDAADARDRYSEKFVHILCLAALTILASLAIFAALVGAYKLLF